MDSISQTYNNGILTPDLVHFWYADLEANRAMVPEYLKLLAKDEVNRASKYKFQKDLECYVISRGILRMLLGYYLAVGSDKIEFVYSDYGKPSVASTNRLKFNCSHSTNMVVFGFALGCEIGVDVEHIKTDFDVLDLAVNFFSQSEIKSLGSRPEQLYRSFYRCWTRKEAFIKAKGSGLSFPLDSFTVSLDDDENAKLLETHWDVNEVAEWRVFSFVPRVDYMSAVAVRSKEASIVYRNWDTFSLQGG
ncbi:MAG: 4'-phosphopantetheinyl transferase family protein [Flavobacteriaceae bacterium]